MRTHSACSCSQQYPPANSSTSFPLGMPPAIMLDSGDIQDELVQLVEALPAVASQPNDKAMLQWLMDFLLLLQLFLSQEQPPATDDGSSDRVGGCHKKKQKHHKHHGGKHHGGHSTEPGGGGSPSNPPTQSPGGGGSPSDPPTQSPGPGGATPAPGAPGLSSDPNDPSHTLSSSAPPAIQKYKKEIEDASRETGVPADMIAAVMWAESRGNPDESSTNIDGNEDVGLMQISSSTYNDVRNSQGGPDLDVNNPADNIRAGAWELRDKFMNNGNDWSKALAAYRGVEDGEDDSYASAVIAFYEALMSGGELADDGRW
ncbi:hypothetical protein EGT07_21735 [Herbaspirillum sp. HC18]|nr:hypothetical protein EGT07_21735 [Herbaspirillum sp. HC18]